MSQSAVGERRAKTAVLITRCAQRLTDQHGLDGFTMNQLAECAGVSRRTLFNYVPGKLDAVLGPEQDPDPALIDAFMRGGPSGHLMVDIKELVVSMLETKDADPGHITRMRRILESDPRVHKAAHERFAKAAGLFADAIVEREGPDFDPATARIAATFTLALCDTALNGFIAAPATPIAEHYARAFDIAVALFD